MDIEEDIKKLENLKKYLNLLINAIDHVLAERDEDQKYTIHLTDEQYRKVIENAQKDMISKQKVKDKIEELKKKDMTIYFGKRTHSKTFQQTVREVEIKLLEDLLEDK